MKERRECEICGRKMKAKYVVIACIIILFIIASLPGLSFDIAVVQAATPSVITDNATSITTTGATLYGTLDDLDTASSANVSFQWGITDEYGSETTPQVKSEIGTFSASLSGLSPGTTYHFNAKAVGDGTGSGYGADKTFTTATGTTPPVVTTSDASGITATGATLNGDLTAKGTSDNITVQFQWGTSITYGTYTTTQVMTTTGTFNTSLSGLSPDTTYHFRAVAHGNGTSYGADKTFTTGTGSSAVTTNDSTNITDTGATLKGNLTSLGTATSVAVSFEWGTTTSYGNETTTQTMTETGTFSASLSDLSPGTTYHFRAKVVGDDTSYGADKTFTPVTTSSAVTTNDATNITDTGATLKGNLTSLGTATSVAVSFEWGTTTSYGNETTTQTMTTTGAFSANLTGLNPHTTYYFRTKAVDGGTNYGAKFSFQTKAASAPPPSDQDGSSFFEDLDWLTVALIGGGAAVLILLLFIMLKPRPQAAAERRQGEVQQQARRPQRTFTCPKCGSQNVIGQQFCGACGQMFQYNCPQCGAVVAAGSKSCPNCGMGMNWGT